MSLTEKYFDRIADKYLEKSDRGVWSHLRTKEKKVVLEALELSPGMTCLELGCGAGFYTSLLSTFFPSLLVAVDYSHNMLSHLKVANARRVRADIQNVAFKVKFDRILCAGALEFLPDLQGFLSNMERFLSDKGIMVLLLPKKGIGGFIYKMFHRAHGVAVSLYDEEELILKMQDCHWKLEKLSLSFNW